MSESPYSERSINSSRINSPNDRLSDADAHEEVSYCGGSQRSLIELQIPIYVETLTGTTFELQVLPYDTINQIKMKLEDSEGIPASQQHLIWQGEELRNELTVEEYGIGFGTILRLVLGLRGGPIVRTPSTAESDQILGSHNEERDENDRSPSPHPLTILIFHNGDQIQMFTITPTVSSEGNEESNGYVLGSTESTAEELQSKCNTDIDKDEWRRKEDEEMKYKMEELQAKMQIMALKRINNREHMGYSKHTKNQTSTKLPMLGKNTNKALQEKNKLKNNKQISSSGVHLPTISSSGVHLPPISSILASHSTAESSFIPAPSAVVSTATNSYKTDAETQNPLQQQLSRLRRYLQSNDAAIKQLQRSYTSSPHKRDSRKSSLLNQYTHLWSNLVCDGQEKETQFASDITSTIGSIDTSDMHIKRPKTTPIVGKIKFNTNKKLHSRGSHKMKGKKTPSPSKDRNHHHVINRKITSPQKSPQKLPPLRVKSSKRQLKLKCSQCRKKLGISNRYECRCGHMFCSIHRYSEVHNCSYDYKTEGRRILEMNNPMVTAPKLPKI